jgi:diguanylate cyclase (GGDEF)-like protein/PAS domain S-box-containing protein
MLTFNRSRKTRLAWFALGIGCLASVFAALQVRQGIEQAAVRQFALNCDQVAIKIQERLGAYALILRGGAALFAASATVERNAWRAYVETLRASGSVPGVQGIGFAEVIPPEELASHVARIRGEGFPDYRVRPPGARALYTSIIYLEPFRDRNLRAFGFDMYAEPVRRAAMDWARDSGEAALSGKVELVQETGIEIQAGTLLYVPVYRNGAPTDTREQRRAALLGWAYSPYRMHDLMTGILGDGESYAGKTLDLTIYDGRDVSPSGLLFDSQPDRASAVHSPFRQQRKLDLHGRPWLLAFDHTASAPGIGNAFAWTTLAGGLALSGLLFWLILALINTRENAARIAGELTEKSRCHEALLSESEAFKNAILNAISAEIAVVGRDGSILAVNEPWRRFAVDNGHESGQPALQTDVGINYLEVCRTGTGCRAEDDGSSAGAGIRAVLDGRLPRFRLEYPYHSPTQQRWFVMSVTPLARGTVAGAVITHTDITERKQAELALRQSETKFRALFDATSDAVMLLDEDGFLDCNKATLAVFGCATPEEFCSYHPADLSPPQQPCGTDSMTLSNRQIALALKNGGCRFEWMHKRLDNGQTFIAEVLLSAIPLEDRTILLASLHDITERKRLEDEREAALRLLQKIADRVPGVVYQYRLHPDGSSCMPFASEAIREIFRISLKDVRQDTSSLFAMIHPDDLERVQASIQQSARNLIKWDQEFRVKSDDGRLRWLLGNALPEREADGATLWHGFITDITERRRTEVAMAETRTLLLTVIDTVPIRVFWKDCNLCYLGCNTAFARDAGMTHPRDVIGKDDHQMAWAAQAELYRADDRSVMASGIPKLSYDEQQTTPSGQTIWIRTSKVALRDRDNAVFGLLGIYEDITERKQAEEKIQLAANVFTHAWEGIMITAADGTILDVNDAFSRITSYRREDVLGRTPRLLSSGRHEPAFYANLWGSHIERGQWSGEIWNRRNNGEVYAVMQTISAVPDAHGNTRQYVALFSDITLIKEQEHTLQHIAHYDALTDLPNRVLLADRLRQGMVQAQRYGRLLAVAFLDLDGFKAINDEYGHAVGDQLLIAAAAGMQQVLREGDTLARIGGDEFVAVLLDLADIQASVPLLVRLLAAAAQAVPVDGQVLHVSASVGVTFYPQADAIDPEQLLHQSDQAMYQAKLAGKNRYHVFDA